MERIGERRKPIAHRVVLTAGLMALAGAVPARRSVKLAGTSFALVLALMSALWLAPFAGAVPAVCPDDNPACQTDIPGVPDNPDTGGPGDTGDDITDPIEETTDPVTDPIEDTTDPITDPIEDTTDPILEEDEGLDVPDAGGILNPEPPTFEEPTGPVDDGLKDVRKTIETIGSIDSPTGPIDSGEKIFERVEPVLTQDRPKDSAQEAANKTSSAGEVKSPAFANFAEARSSSGMPADSGRHLDAAFAAESEGLQPGLFGRVGEVSVEVAKKLAFPLALLLLVAGFLLIHNRIDRKDPKLAHAPVSADNDSLSFE